MVGKEQLGNINIYSVNLKFEEVNTNIIFDDGIFCFWFVDNGEIKIGDSCLVSPFPEEGYKKI